MLKYSKQQQTILFPRVPGIIFKESVDRQKTNLVWYVFQRSPDWGDILTSRRKTEKKMHSHEYASWVLVRTTCHIPGTTEYVRNSIPPVLCSSWHGEECGAAFLCCCSVPLPSFPWPIQNNFVTVGCSRVCVGLLLARLCFNCVYWAFSSVFSSSFTAKWRLFCTMVRVRGRVGTAVLFLSRKVAARLSEWVCCLVEGARLNSENVASEKRK